VTFPVFEEFNRYKPFPQHGYANGSGVRWSRELAVEAAECIGVAVGNLVKLFSPEVVVLGGGVVEALEDEIRPSIVKTARQHVLAGTEKDLQIIGSTLGDNAGIIGAAVFARQSSSGKA